MTGGEMETLGGDFDSMPDDEVKCAGFGPGMGFDAGLGGIMGGEEDVDPVARGDIEFGDCSYSEKAPVVSCIVPC